MSKSVDQHGVAERLPSGTPDETAVPDDVSQERIFKLMSNERRRYTLHLLQQYERAVELGDIAEQIAAWENEKSVRDVSSTERKSVYSALQQFHLPKLEDMGMVEFDDREGVVGLGPATEEVDIYLEVVESTDVPWSYYYLALAVVGAGLVTSGVLTTYPLSLVSPAAAGAFVVTALAVSSLLHMYYSRTEMRLGTGERPPALER